MRSFLPGGITHKWLLLRLWQTRTHCCGHIVAHMKEMLNETLLLILFLGRANARDTKWMLCFHAAKTGKRLLRTQNVCELNQKQFLCPGHKICVCNKCSARGQTGKHLCRQQCVLVCQGLYFSLHSLCVGIKWCLLKPISYIYCCLVRVLLTFCFRGTLCNMYMFCRESQCRCIWTTRIKEGDFLGY